MRLAILSLFSHRVPISHLYWQGIKRLKDATDHSVTVVAVCSDFANLFLAVHETRMAVFVPNTPLRAKHNTASTLAQHLNPDYVLLLDSDDLMSTSLFFGLLQKMDHGVHAGGPLDLYAYDPVSQQAVYWPGYTDHRAGRTVGTARFWSREVCEALDWNLWGEPFPGWRSGMDALSDHRLQTRFPPMEGYTMRDLGGVLVDVKSPDSLHDLASLHGEHISADRLFPQIPELRPGA